VEGVRAGQPIVVIATAAHRRQFADAMRGRGVEVGLLVEGRDAIWLDAHETLASFMQGPLPDAELFHATVGALFERIQRNRRYVVVRAFGEMVDVLWRQGNVNAAIAVESLWSEVAASYSFSLLCGYSMASHMTRDNASAFKRICAAHGHVLASDSALHNG